ncbi:MAG: hypothetical protein Nkreftii_001387 [Candidatus Nitrospira kreftii]|uniref:SGNH hydrolase-type esterase domain-containing protein n=1 Tax=Candidatus Nitrospira kreftii TaxID=2652173 RepID=A0A7S8FD41_9BACT|nr:MAG: hypothetical protein Nkreftii_001387 [Candidatus Nitrospira kreftii]
MKRSLLVILLVIGLDQLIGFMLNRLYLHTVSGDRGGVINGALRQNSDVLVLGSSRARHHVVPAILQEKLSASVFNAGVDGQDFLYAIMLLDIWMQSHAPPKAILLHVDPTSFAHSKQELDRTSIFSGYFWESQRIRSILLMRGKYEWLKYFSSSYRFNGKVLQIAKVLAMGSDDPSDGYVGLQGGLGNGSILPGDAHKIVSEFAVPFWELKLSYLTEIARYCRMTGTRLILFHSPRLREDPAALAAWSKQLSRLQQSHEGVEFLDLTERTLELFAGRTDLYKDGAHLNASGAEVFSTLLADEVLSRLRQINTNLQ